MYIRKPLGYPTTVDALASGLMVDADGRFTFSQVVVIKQDEDHGLADIVAKPGQRSTGRFNRSGIPAITSQTVFIDRIIDQAVDDQ